MNIYHKFMKKKWIIFFQSHKKMDGFKFLKENKNKKKSKTSLKQYLLL